MFSLAALIEGRNPPINPINRAKISELIMICGESENLNAISEKDEKLSVDI